MTIARWRGGDGDDGRAENLTAFGEAAVGGEEHRFGYHRHRLPIRPLAGLSLNYFSGPKFGGQSGVSLQLYVKPSTEGQYRLSRRTVALFLFRKFVHGTSAHFFCFRAHAPRT